MGTPFALPIFRDSHDDSIDYFRDLYFYAFNSFARDFTYINKNLIYKRER